MTFTVKPASLEEKPIIHSLLQPYLTELSRFPDEHPDYKDKNGIYIYPYLYAYWQEKERFPYLLFSAKEVAGFALVRKDIDHWEMSEFYVKIEYRRMGLAKSCAADILRRHSGIWRIGFNKHNLPSRTLWKKLAKDLSNNDFEEGESDNNHDYIRFSV